MLSYIYRLYRAFELEMGYPPNVLLINHTHLMRLASELGEEQDLAVIRQRLGLEIIGRRDLPHPLVNWHPSAARKAG